MESCVHNKGDFLLQKCRWNVCGAILGNKMSPPTNEMFSFWGFVEYLFFVIFFYLNLATNQFRDATVTVGG